MMRLFGRVTEIECVEDYGNIEEFMRAVNRLVEAGRWFHVETDEFHFRDGRVEPLYRIRTKIKIK